MASAATQSSSKDTSVKAGNRPAVIKRYYPISLSSPSDF